MSERKLSYSKLAELISVDESKLKRVLGGKQQMTLEMRDAIFDALNLRMIDHLPYHIDPNDIIELWSKMPQKMQHSLLIHLHAINRVLEDARNGD
ncbi:helix-turn-helix domain-containing protein [Photobacterium damselae]|uniref:helix-turn-helix domain-containing protein n=1 Tax=Photobacterium damselae TaxID=38293 RepID=UPI001443D6BA|nr:helix-turn-helix transcriptional regulator [Photobacterium damselae]